MVQRLRLHLSSAGCVRAIPHQGTCNTPQGSVQKTKKSEKNPTDSNAELWDLDVDPLNNEHIQENKAPKTGRRTYRAHSQINPYMSSPGHTEMILTEKEQPGPKQGEEVVQKKKDIPGETEETKTYGREINSAKR